VTESHALLSRCFNSGVVVAGKCSVVVRMFQWKDWSRDRGPSRADGKPRRAYVPAEV